MSHVTYEWVTWDSTSRAIVNTIQSQLAPHLTKKNNYNPKSNYRIDFREFLEILDESCRNMTLENFEKFSWWRPVARAVVVFLKSQLAPSFTT